MDRSSIPIQSWAEFARFTRGEARAADRHSVYCTLHPSDVLIGALVIDQDGSIWLYPAIRSNRRVDQPQLMLTPGHPPLRIQGRQRWGQGRRIEDATHIVCPGAGRHAFDRSEEWLRRATSSAGDGGSVHLP